MNTKTLALILLTGHLMAVVLIARVLWRQLKIVRSRPDPQLRGGRIVLLVLALAGLCGNFIPLAVDILVLLNVVSRTKPNPVGVAYALSNVITLIVITGALLALYIIAERLLKNIDD